jgi:hypothetical protein
VQTSVKIQGDGIAARCCAYLLAGAGIPVAFAGAPRPKLPAVMLGDQTRTLFSDVFGQADVFQGLHRIERRIVLWGAAAEPSSLPHSAAVVREQDLLDRLPFAETGASSSDWAIFAGRPLSAVCQDVPFGERTARASAVTLNSGEPACWIESVEAGWLFLVSHGESQAVLLAVGAATDALLESSRLIRRLIVERAPESAGFPAYPRIAWPLCGPDFLACGTAALGFDPLCGDGAGNAIREAILASAVLRAVARGEVPAGLLEHYSARLLAGFERHLAVCREYYSTGGSSPWWRAQCGEIESGLAWCAGQRRGAGPFRYRLSNLDLEAIEIAGTTP